MDDLTLVFDALPKQGLPNHFRTVLDPWARPVDAPPSRQGLDRLLASGSEQPALSALAGSIRKLAPQVMVVDLRQESHAYLGGCPISWYGDKNWANKGKSLAEVEADERARIASLSGVPAVTVAKVQAKDAEGRLSDVQTQEVPFPLAQSEEAAVRSLGLQYFRITVTDHTRPQDAEVDRFVTFVRELAPDVWLHFHCHAGDGRTTTFLLLYDMLRNASALGLEELAARQHLLGGVDLLHTPGTGWKEPLYNARAAFIRRFHAYARTRNFMNVSWTEYLAG
jgi:predicted protein tyrosine phosphatase